MKIEQIYTGCLAQGAYYIESNGEVAIIDPLREVHPYMDKATTHGAKIKYIFETHFHADFVSGHVTLANKTGARIIYGPNAETNFDAVIARDGQEFTLGNIVIKVLHTPGHTMESSTFLLFDEAKKEHAIFTGDTLFLGDVGRPDLAQKSSGMTKELLAETLYDSLRNKIMTLPDSVLVYPGHGAGSACGKNMSKETVGLLGDQKATNYALRSDMTKEEFVKEVTTGLQAPPVYFPLNVQMNKEGYADISEVIEKGTHELTPDEFQEIAENSHALILDVRTQDEFANSHIPNSIFIGLNGGFAPWVGALIGDVKQPLLLVAPEGKEEEAITRLSRVGFDYTLGVLKGGMKAWENASKEVEKVEGIDAVKFSEVASESKIFDVRKETEFASERIENAKNTPLSNLNSFLKEFPEVETFYLHCAGGYRSMIAASILKQRGIHNFIDVKGGFAAIQKTAIKTTAFVCPSALK
ncbi:MBL fold metallo-hydrolase [Flavicella marina]|uniref:MBL fold metallo-hydrolase n=1 Tax=Flavicella marina TaxID=1475951 RepID=UPI0012648E15|nr:MBL fold metallo-hydrolase [Flavicella marina]